MMARYHAETRRYARPARCEALPRRASPDSARLQATRDMLPGARRRAEHADAQTARDGAFSACPLLLARSARVDARDTLRASLDAALPAKKGAAKAARACPCWSHVRVYADARYAAMSAPALPDAFSP